MGIASYMNRKSGYVLSALVIGMCLWNYFSVFYASYEMKFDDSFITYRYSQNLSEGYGLVWNKGEHPVEGFTSLLHVFVLVPFHWMGADPLLATRLLSVMSALGICLLFALYCRRRLDAGWDTALIIGALYIPLGFTAQVTMLGLETVIFTALSFYAFYIFSEYLETPIKKNLILLCAMLFIAFLARPEAGMLALVILMLLLVRPGDRASRLSIMRTLGLYYALPIAVYFIFKRLYFGDFLPNPYYIKAGSGTLISMSGMHSVEAFYKSALALATIALASFVIRQRDGLARAGSLIFIILFSAFYLHVDTLMDGFGRFMHPVSPFLYFLMLPLAVSLLNKLSAGVMWRLPIALAVIVLSVNWMSPAMPIKTIKFAMKGIKQFADPGQLMNKEYIVAKRLGEYPDIKNVSIALGDAGLIPYYTGAKTLDLVGLNDRYIAREKDLARLSDYFFSKKITLVINPSNPDMTWIKHGDGVLGNLTSWAHDQRWDDYGYAGTVFTDKYHLNLFVMKDYPGYYRLVYFIRQYIADTVVRNFPLRLGTRYTFD